MKRTSDKELNHENWNDEEVPEERGKFSTANPDILSKRKVISARRKPAVSQTGVFKSFSGFKANPLSTVNTDNKEMHLICLKKLNKTFLENIEKHVNENNACILSPLFEDYQRHLTTIKTKYPLSEFPAANVSNSPCVSITSSTTNLQNVPGLFIFNQSTTFSQAAKPTTIFSNSESFFKSQNTFEEKAKAEDKPSFSFVTKSVEKPLFTFSSSASKPQENILSGQPNLFETNKVTESKSESMSSLFGEVKIPTVAPVTVIADDDEEYVPPKAETKEVKESDSVFDIRCKLFYQTDKKWKEKGVGNIFIKPKSPGKFQLVMRADNSLGTILLNVLITNSMPLATNKNNVSLVAMTDFVSGELKLTPLLIRVKSAEKAEELLSAMKEQLN